ncbi:MAG TPA: BRO family protein [Tepidisphaeraceae bacterium]|jgi:DNA-damage-inducible protein D|nr:BRO family protein [Tepidisphaeraceae bacterium]
MSGKTIHSPPGGEPSPFEKIKRVNPAGNEFWSSRDFARVLGYSDYRNFELVIGKAKIACFNSGQRLDDHFVDITDMVEIGSRAKRPVATTLMSRYACYLAVQNADPTYRRHRFGTSLAFVSLLSLETDTSSIARDGHWAPATGRPVGDYEQSLRGNHGTRCERANYVGEGPEEGKAAAYAGSP